MHSTVPSSETYGPGSFMDKEYTDIPSESRRILSLIAKETPGFTQSQDALDTVAFEGGSDPIIPGPIKAPAVAAALHAMCGMVANEIIDKRDGKDTNRRVNINTDHAAFWLGTVGLFQWNGMDLKQIIDAGKLQEFFKVDFEKGAFRTPLRARATANYPTKTPGVWYQLHGSLDSDPVLRAIGLDPDTLCESPEAAYKLISQYVQRFSADELEMMNVRLGLCGNISYTPAGWRETEMSKYLSKHPLVNYKLQSHALPTPPVPLPQVQGDGRPLAGIKVLELVRIIAGPVVGNTLAALGADVIRVNCSQLRDLNSLQATLNAGIRTIDIDLAKSEDLTKLLRLIEDTDIFVQGYRPGVIAKNGLSLSNLLEIAGRRGKGIVYVEENCYGPDGPFHSRPGWQQTGDAASGASYVTAKSMGHTDGRSILPALPIPDMMTGLIGALGALMAIRDRAQNGGSYHVFASLTAAAAYPLNQEIGLHTPEVVDKVNKRFQWDSMDPSMFVFELLQVVVNGWKKVFPDIFDPEFPFTTQIQGDWGSFDLLKPVVNLEDARTTPEWKSAPVPHCYHDANTISWI